jgi:hypothetical protein
MILVSPPEVGLLDLSMINTTPGVQLEGQIVVDTSRMPSVHGSRANRQTALVSDEEVTKIDVNVTLVLGGDRGTLEVSANVNGRRCGRASIRHARGGLVPATPST